MGRGRQKLSQDGAAPRRKFSRMLAFGFGLGSHRDGQSEKIDEALGVLGIVTAHGKAGEVRTVKRKGRKALSDVERALPEFQADRASDALLGHAEKTIERFTERREPQSVIDEFGVTHRKSLLKVGSFPVESEPFQFAVRGNEERSPGGFIRPARLHAHKAIFNKVSAANAVLCGNVVQCIKKFNGRELLAVHGNGRACFKANHHLFRLVWSLIRRNNPLPHRFAWGVRKIFQVPALVAQVPDIAVAAVDVGATLFHRDLVLLRIGDGVFARVNGPLPPGSDDGEVGSNGLVRQLKTDLVISLAGTTMREAVGAELQGEFGLTLGQHGARHGSAEQVGMLVNSAGTERGPDVITNKFLAEIFDIGGGCAGGESLLAGGLEIFLLANIADHGDYFAAVIFAEPWNDDGRIQAAGIGEYDFLGFHRLRYQRVFS